MTLYAVWHQGKQVTNPDTYDNANEMRKKLSSEYGYLVRDMRIKAVPTMEWRVYE